jgi:hypothetical protein
MQNLKKLLVDDDWRQVEFILSNISELTHDECVISVIVLNKQKSSKSDSVI